jgi:hypothetical protein
MNTFNTDLLKLVSLAHVSEQRRISKIVFEQIMRARVLPVRLGTKEAINSDWPTTTDSFPIDPVMDGFPNGHVNYGITYPLGWADLDIDSSDPFFAVCILSGLEFTGVRAEFSYGRSSRKYDGAAVPSHIFLKINGDPDGMKKLFSAPVWSSGKSDVQIRFTPTKKGVAKTTQQTVIPGSIHINPDGTVDTLQWINYKTETTPTTHELADVVNGIAIGKLLYLLREYWVKGNQHNFALRFTGWLARVAVESNKIHTDAAHPLHGNALAPIRNEEQAAQLVRLICKFYEDPDDDETEDRLRGLKGAFLDLNLGGKVSGRVALAEEMKSKDVVRMMDSLLIAGTSLNAVHELLSDLILDLSEDGYIYYIWRSRFNLGSPSYRLTRDVAYNLNKGKKVVFGKSTVKAFDLFEESSEREEATGGVSLFPDNASGELLMVRNGVVLPDNYCGDMTGVWFVFNPWRGFACKPTRHPNPERGEAVIALLDWLLSQITRDNAAQIRFVKMWTADLFQHPGKKLPIAIVSLGGKGWGKSLYFNGLIPRLVGETLSGRITNTIISGKFPIDSYKNKLYMVGNELKALNDAEKPVLGNFIKDEIIAGESKNARASNYKNLARTAITMNGLEFNITTKDTPHGEPERSLYYIRCWDVVSKNMTPSEYTEHRLSLKPKFDDVIAMLRDEDDMAHLMHYFRTYEYNADDLFDLSTSSHHDPDIIEQNMDYVTSAVRMLLAENNFSEDGSRYDTTPPTRPNNRWGAPLTLRGIRNVLDAYARVESRYTVKADDVITRMIELAMVTQRGAVYLPIVKYGTALKLFKQNTGVEVPPAFTLTDDDFGGIDAAATYTPPPREKR